MNEKELREFLHSAVEEGRLMLTPAQASDLVDICAIVTQTMISTVRSRQEMYMQKIRPEIVKKVRNFGA